MMFEIRLAICSLLTGWILRIWPQDHAQYPVALVAIKMLNDAQLADFGK